MTLDFAMPYRWAPKTTKEVKQAQLHPRLNPLCSEEHHKWRGTESRKFIPNVEQEQFFHKFYTGKRCIPRILTSANKDTENLES